MGSGMRVAVLEAPGRVRVEEAPVPLPGPGELRVRLEGCGVCASNLPLWEGRPWFEYPRAPGAPGHEGWGVVDAVAEDVTGIAKGDRVAMLSYQAYAEYDLARADHVLKLPPEIDGDPFPGECLGCAMNIYRRSQITRGENVAIVGIGFLGSLLTRLAAQAGARVLAISRRPFALDLARAMGASEVLSSENPQAVIADVLRATGGRGCECVIEATGLQASLDLSAELTAERARLVIAGYHQDAPRSVNMQLWNWRGLDVINAHERDPAVYVDGMRRALGSVLRGEIEPLALYTHSFGLSELGDALEAVRERPNGMLKALIRV